MAAFQGGTCLRIFHDLRRFSEDLDFISLKNLEHFSWEKYLAFIKSQFDCFGLSIAVKDKKEAQGPVKTAFLKEDSFVKILLLDYQRNKRDIKKILIKLEIDTNPASGSSFEKNI